MHILFSVLSTRVYVVVITWCAKWQPVGKTAFKERVRRLCNSATAWIVAGNYARNLRKVCQVVIQKKGRASGF